MKKLILFLFIVCAIPISKINAQNERFKALFMYNYTKHVEWPASQRSGNFVIGVIGNSSIFDEITLIASKQRVGMQNIIVKSYSSVDEVDNCHMLYIASGKSSIISQAVSKLVSTHTLIITDKESSIAKGSCINFVADGNKLTFEVSKSNIEKMGLVVSNSLLTLGIAVN